MIAWTRSVGRGVGQLRMTTSIADFRACRADAAFVSCPEITGRSWPIQPAAGNAGWASWLQLEHHRPGVPEPVRSAKSSNANGVPSQSPGLARSAYPGSTAQTILTTPTGLRPTTGRDASGTPLGFDGIGRGVPRVAPAAQPWALGQNPVGVRRDWCRSAATSAEPVAPHEPPPASRFRRVLDSSRRSRCRRAWSAAVGERGRSPGRTNVSTADGSASAGTEDVPPCSPCSPWLNRFSFDHGGHGVHGDHEFCVWAREPKWANKPLETNADSASLRRHRSAFR